MVYLNLHVLSGWRECCEHAPGYYGAGYFDITRKTASGTLFLTLNEGFNGIFQFLFTCVPNKGLCQLALTVKHKGGG